MKLIKELKALNGGLVVFLLVVTGLILPACDEEEISVIPSAPQISITDGYFVARAGDDRSILTGDTVILKATFAENQRNNSFRWRFISKPSSSQVELDNPVQSVVSFEADQPGIYLLELGMFFDQYSSFDTVKVSAFTIKNLQGSYSSLEKGANGLIRQFLVFQDILYAGGDFTRIGGVDTYALASFDGKQWSGMGEELQIDQVYQMIEFQNKMFISGSSREAGRDGVRKFAFWDGTKWQNLGFTSDGSHMDVYQGVLYLNFGNRLGRWDGHSLTYLNIPLLESITFLKTANDRLYLRGYNGERCVNSTEDIWVYNCEATGLLLEFDGLNWSEVSVSEGKNCLNIGAINWSYHIWIDSEPDFKWNLMTGFQDKLFFTCGYSENGIFSDFPYPFEQIYTLVNMSEHELYLAGRNQKTGDYTGIMKWNGQQWFTLGKGIDGEVFTMQEYQGKLYIGGTFNRSPGQPQINFTIWEGN